MTVPKALFLLLVLVSLGQAQTFTTIYAFASSEADGGNPDSTLVLGPGGSLYGSGYADGGSVFQLTPPAEAGQPWTSTVLLTSTLSSGIVTGTKNALYGIEDAGTESAPVFRLTPPSTMSGSWTETIIYTFLGVDNPPNSLFVAPGGLYGTTFRGGPNAAGTFFKLTPPQKSGDPWTQTVIFNFAADGGYPNGLIQGPNGSLFGTGSSLFGSFGCVFQLLPPTQSGGAWTENILYRFQGAPDGSGPEANPVLSSSGVLYGNTVDGGTSNKGVVWSLTPPASPGGIWIENVLHSFKGKTAGNDGSYPIGTVSLTAAGLIYGVTESGGAGGTGIVYQLAPPSTPDQPWAESIVHSFEAGGSSPESGLTASPRGVIYGTTADGGETNQAGTVFAIVP